MKKWQKKIIVLSVIWIVGGVALFAAVSMLFCNVIFSGVYADFGKYVDVAKRLEFMIYL